jgi:hypothetical protein
MSKQHHFVVVYDTELNRFMIEDETLFFDGTIFDTETQEWSRRVEDAIDYAVDDTLYGSLSSLLNSYNESQD